MSHSVLVLADGERFVRDGVFKTDHVSEAAACRARLFYLDMIAKEERSADGAVTVYLNDNFCALRRDDGYAVYICLGEFHDSDPIIILPLSAVIRTDGDHEFECHHRELPVM